MKLRVLALDYDGTIAVNDRMDSGVRNALADARSHKIVVALVTGRRTLLLGHTDEGGPFALGLRGRNVLVAGDAGSGKSWVAGLLAEQLILHGYSVCVIDPEGNYRQLQALPGVVALGGADLLPRPHELFHALQHAESSVVVDLSHVHHSDKLHYTHALLPALATLRRRSGLPHRVILDEAHYFLNGEPAHDLLDLEGNGYTLVTYRASHLPTAVLDATEVVLVTCESDPAEVAALHRLSRSTEPLETWRGMLGGLELGEAAALPATDEAGATLCRIHLGLRVTPHVRHREKYVDVPVPEARAFVFTGTGMPDEPRARTLKEFVVALEVRTAEERCRDERDPGAVSAIASAVRGRYDLTSAWEIPCGQAAAMM